MNGYVIGAIVLFFVSSVIVLSGVTSANRQNMSNQDTPGLVGPKPTSWLLPALAMDAIALGLMVYGLSR